MPNPRPFGSALAPAIEHQRMPPARISLSEKHEENSIGLSSPPKLPQLPFSCGRTCPAAIIAWTAAAGPVEPPTSTRAPSAEHPSAARPLAARDARAAAHTRVRSCDGYGGTRQRKLRVSFIFVLYAVPHMLNLSFVHRAASRRALERVLATESPPLTGSFIHASWCLGMTFPRHTPRFAEAASRMPA